MEYFHFKLSINKKTNTNPPPPPQFLANLPLQAFVENSGYRRKVRKRKEDICKRVPVDQDSDYKEEKHKFRGLRSGGIRKTMLPGERSKRKSSLSLENRP